MTKTIHPYLLDGVWVFDDPDTQLVQEPFVRGASEMITRLVLVKDIPDAEHGFALHFSDVQPDKFDTDAVLEWFAEEDDGNWYRTTLGGDVMTGWLCPALFKYFDKAPQKIYVTAEPRN